MTIPDADLFRTVSVCPTCCREIPASVVVRDGLVVMAKTCPAHGDVAAVLEKNVPLYVDMRRSRACIYPGFFIDVTTRCNLACPYCFYPCRESPDVPAADLLSEIQLFAPNMRVYFTGGEPTLRPDLIDLFRAAKATGGPGAGMPTNGIGLLDRQFLKEILSVCARNDEDGAASISFSWHYDLNAKTINRVVEHLRDLEDRVSGPIFVMRDLAQMSEIVDVSLAMRDVISAVRIHVATDTWEAGPQQTIFASDMLRVLADLAKERGVSFRWLQERSNARFWLVTEYDGLTVYLVRWPTAATIDLCESWVDPTYRAHNGEVVSLTYGFIINEAMQRGWLKGRQMPRP